MQGSIPNVVAGCLALTAFVIAITAGLVQDNPATTILARAVAVMIICYPVGLLAGFVCLRTLERNISEYLASNPPPAVDDVARADGDDDDLVEAVEVVESAAV